ncbi:MAG: glycine cleavage system protein GcvH [Propionicimonas sp.]
MPEVTGGDRCQKESTRMFPDDLRYSSKHEWVRQGVGTTVRVGITSYAAEALGDVVYVSLPQIGEEIAVDDACAEVESTKSVSDVYSPATGVVTAVNELLNATPETINSDPYGDGWIFELELADAEELDDLLDADAYAELVSG